MREIKMTVTSMSVHEKDESPIFGTSTIKVALEDEGAGIFLVLEDGECNKVAINIDEVPRVIEAIKLLVDQDAMDEDDREAMRSISISQPNTKKEKE